jgi:hypothetical protein
MTLVGLIDVIGLGMDLAGAVLLGVSSRRGSEAGSGGAFRPKGRGREDANVVGWALLIVGFLFQLIAACIRG